jgi:CubicO group peptidase (beta-lactamase class C family)
MAVRFKAAVAVSFVVWFCCHLTALAAGDHFPGTEWDHAGPAQAGWSVGKLDAAQKWSELIGTTAVVIVQHGAIVAAWGETSANVSLHSARKSLLSALIGIAVAKRQIDLNETLAGLGIDDNPPSLTAEEKHATVRDLLEARSGVYHPANYETPDMAARRPPRGSHPHDTF